MSSKRTPFRTELDGFAFANSWTMTDSEKSDVNAIIAILTAPGGPLWPLVLQLSSLPPFCLIPFGGGVYAAAHAVANYCMNHSAQGYCGGMAYSSLDYYLRNWIVPRGQGQNDQPGGNHPLRHYIWSRLLDSLDAGGAGQWICECFCRAKLGQAIDSTGDFAQLKRHVDAGQPWPIILFRDVDNPLASHQVLAIGYDDPGDGTATIITYDNNNPDVDTPYAFNFRQGAQFCSTDTAVRAIKCSNYTPKGPPIAVGQSAGLDVGLFGAPYHPPQSFVMPKWGASVGTQNIGFHQSPKFRLRLIAQHDLNGPLQDIGGELDVAPLGENEERKPIPLDLLALTIPDANVGISVGCEVRANDGTFLRRVLPALNATVRPAMLITCSSQPIRILVHLSSIGDWTFTDSTFAGASGHRLEGFQINLPFVPTMGQMQYTAHVQGIGDVGPCMSGQFIGTRGQSKRLEGFTLKMTGQLANRFDVRYKCLMDGVGWSPDCTNGEFCGTRGQGRRIQGIMVSLTPRQS